MTGVQTCALPISAWDSHRLHLFKLQDSYHGAHPPGDAPKVVDAASLEAFKSSLDGDLGSLIWWVAASLWQWAGTGWVPFKPRCSMILVLLSFVYTAGYIRGI